MPSANVTRDLKALHRLIHQADLVLDTIQHPSIPAARESLKAALALSTDLAKRQPDAAALGSKGGKKTAERGSDYYAKIAAMRTNRKGGRPRKQPE